MKQTCLPPWIAAFAVIAVSLGWLEPATGAESPTEIPPPLKRFIDAKEKQVRGVAKRVGLEVAPEVEDCFKAARRGDWADAMNAAASAREALRGGDDSDGNADQRSLVAVSSAALLELQIGFEQIMETDPKLALAMGEAMVASVSPGAIYFGGTDPGRGLPTVLSVSHEKGDPFFTLTQRALADGRYLTYLRDMYGRQLYMPSEKDSEKAFQDYMKDAQRRLEHDRDHPAEPRQLKPGEDVRFKGGKVQVSGQVAVMSINALLAKVIFDQNPDREFYLEESFPLDWMYPHLAPRGMILKLNRSPMETISPAEVTKDRTYWAERQKALLGNSVKPGASLDEVCQFVRRVDVDHNLAGFTGDKKFLQTDPIRKAYGKMRSAIAGVYAWRMAQPGDPKETKRMATAADEAFLQAFAFSPTSPEVIFRYVNLLVGQKRIPEALKVAELASELPTESNSLDSLIKELKRIRDQ